LNKQLLNLISARETKKKQPRAKKQAASLSFSFLLVPFLGTLLYIYCMRIIAKSRLKSYWSQKAYRSAEQPLKAWYDEVRQAHWKNYNDLRGDFPKASLVGNGRVVFDIQGGIFRLIVKFEFRMNAVFIRFFGTHKEYDTIKANEA
jgi:mRNA interferase HigB